MVLEIFLQQLGQGKQASKRIQTQKSGMLWPRHQDTQAQEGVVCGRPPRRRDFRRGCREGQACPGGLEAPAPPRPAATQVF